MKMARSYLLGTLPHLVVLSTKSEFAVPNPNANAHGNMKSGTKIGLTAEKQGHNVRGSNSLNEFAMKDSATGSSLGNKFAARKLNTGYAQELASNLQIFVTMGENFDHGEDCSLADWNLCYTQTITLKYAGSSTRLDGNFKIYFSAIHRLLDVKSPSFTFQHVIGDLTYIEPTSNFLGFAPNTSTDLLCVFEYWQVQESDVMPRWFLVDERDNSVAVIENTNTENLRDFVTPFTSHLKTSSDNNTPAAAENRFHLNEDMGASPKVETPDPTLNHHIIPSPYRITETGDTFEIIGLSIQPYDLLGTLQVGAINIREKLGIGGGGHTVTLSIGALPSDIDGPESYVLDIASTGSSVVATTPSGLFNGLMSLFNSIHGGTTLKAMKVEDKPRFEYRGHQVDVARNFRSVDTIQKTIDAMALWKLNNLHLALTNDEGWRLEIPGLEELTEVGSKRCFDPDEETCLLTQLGSGPVDSDTPKYYSREEYIELLRYANERNVKIIPEFNMPAHARAAVISMEARAKNGDDSYRLTDPNDETYLLTIQFYDRTSIINPCLHSSVRFVEKVVREVISMHMEAGVQLDSYHFGGDEAKNILLGNGYSSYPDELKQLPFSKSPACTTKAQNDPTFDIERIANYWALTVNKILANQGISEMVAWEDGIRGTSKSEYATGSVSVNFWETLYWGGINGLVDIAKQGFDVIMANPDYLYFDFPYEVNPEERGYYWAARFNSVYKVFSFAPENMPQNAETSLDRDGNTMHVVTPNEAMPKITGMQGQTWSETMRTDDQYFEMAFPRALAIAERAWHRGTWELDWEPGATYNSTTGLVPKVELANEFQNFATTLGCKEVAKLEQLGIGYRVPPPGAVVKPSGVLVINSELPCTKVKYSVDGMTTWSDYSMPVTIGFESVVHVISVSPRKALSSRTVSIDMRGCKDCPGLCSLDDKNPFSNAFSCPDLQTRDGVTADKSVGTYDESDSVVLESGSGVVESNGSPLTEAVSDGDGAPGGQYVDWNMISSIAGMKPVISGTSAALLIANFFGMF